jgi:hypothetical protein
MTDPDMELTEGSGRHALFLTRFVSRDERARARAQLASERVLVVAIEPVGASARGRLADVIDEAIERELEARGAASPGIGSTSDADAALGDQLFRARRVGVRGIALVIGPLRAAASPRGALEAEDSATLRFWAAAARERPVALVLDVDDARMGAYGDPVPLGALLDSRVARPEHAVPNDDTPPPHEELVLDATTTLETPPPVAVAVAVPVPVPVPVPAPRMTPPAAIATPAPLPPKLAPTPPPPEPDLPTLDAVVRQAIGASVASESDAWRSWTLALTAARGPQPLGAFERLFAHDYMPLANAIAGGLEDPRALHAHDEFRRTFSRSYTEACPTFALTGKRPKMVLDAPDVAARIARLHGARSTQLLLVDAMRFDLGAMVKTELARALGSRGSLTDETILWSSLPTTSSRQLETLTRGIDALRSAPPEVEREADPLRGRTAEMIRRIKIGSRDVYKLDLAETRLREGTIHALDMLPELAESLADVISRHAMTLQPRTLLFVFGDHGFILDKGGAPHQGGASPEEVLVPAFAFLIGEVH